MIIASKQFGNSPLYLAQKSNSKDVENLLRESGAEVGVGLPLRRKLFACMQGRSSYASGICSGNYSIDNHGSGYLEMARCFNVHSQLTVSNETVISQHRKISGQNWIH